MAVLSLIVLGVVLTIWVRSHVLGDTLCWRRSPQQWEALSIDGLLILSGGELMSKYNPPEGWRGTFWPFDGFRGTTDAPGIWRNTYGGFLYERHNRREADYVNVGVAVGVPYWFVALVAGGVATWSLRSAWAAVRSWRRVKQGRCVQCGYDLRATPDRCPECGTESPKAATRTRSIQKTDTAT